METVLTAIADRLEKAYADKARINGQIFRLEEDLSLQTLNITPADGNWPGSNDTLRKAAKEKALNSDSLSLKIMAQIRDLKFSLFEVAGAIEGLEAQRRAEEWMITGRMADALKSRSEHPVRPSNSDITRAAGIAAASEAPAEFSPAPESVSPDQDAQDFYQFLGQSPESLMDGEIPFNVPGDDIPF